jgi:hypothetical protein
MGELPSNRLRAGSQPNSLRNSPTGTVRSLTRPILRRTTHGSARYYCRDLSEFQRMRQSNKNTGTGSTESTGNVVTSKAGMVLELSSEYSSTNFAYTQSDTNFYTAENGAITATGEAQYKITSGPGTYVLTVDNKVNNLFWLAVGVAYSSATTTQTRAR